MDDIRTERLGTHIGKRDSQTVFAGGAAATLPKIAGVHVIQLGNVLTRSGSLLELFRRDWPKGDVDVQQVTWIQLNPNAVTDWHKHDLQTDRLVGIGGNIRLALWDDRAQSPTCGQSEILRLGILRPTMVLIPPGVWHGLRNESGESAGYLNVIDQPYDYARPDNWRLAPGTEGVPDIL